MANVEGREKNTKQAQDDFNEYQRLCYGADEIEEQKREVRFRLMHYALEEKLLDCFDLNIQRLSKHLKGQ